MKPWIWIQQNWRKLLVRTALLYAAGVFLALVVTAEFYFMGLNGPKRIPWTLVAEGTLRDWAPWLMLSPLVVVLAELFRFDWQTWRRALLVHVLACVLAAIAYESLLIWMLPPFQVRVFTSEGFEPTNGVRVGRVVGFNGSLNLPTNLPPFTRPNFGAARPQVFPAEAGASFIVHLDGSNRISNLPATALPLPAYPVGVVSAVGPGFPMPGLWRGLLHRAARRMQFTTPIYCCIVCVCWVVTHFRESRERERRALELEKRLTQANLQTLKMQLQPHFLFNTLNAIASLVRRKPDAAEDMIGSLSDFLRMNLDTAQQHEVPLRREIEFLDLYLEIQQTRFGERLRIQKEIAPDALDVAVPTLILQPLVENSVRHGIEPREQGGTILIRAQRRENSLQLEVRDNGEGLKGGQLAAIREGVGLSNTKARLQELYGDTHRFLLTPNPGGGLAVRLEVPWRELEANTAKLAQTGSFV